jgi:8-oxo-dGTP diphosphatase
MESKKHFEVAAAVIMRDGKKGTTELFCARRPGPKPGKEANETNYKWEFPGGKLEPGETAEQAVVREIREEFDTDIAVKSFLVTVNHEYRTFGITMHCFLCTVKSGNLVLREHLDSRWITPDQLDDMDWAPADMDAVNSLKKTL